MNRDHGNDSGEQAREDQRWRGEEADRSVEIMDEFDPATGTGQGTGFATAHATNLAARLMAAQPGPWSQVRTDELTALHRVAQEAREAVEIAADAGVHLGPLRAALDETAYTTRRTP